MVTKRVQEVIDKVIQSPYFILAPELLDRTTWRIVPPPAKYTSMLMKTLDQSGTDKALTPALVEFIGHVDEGSFRLLADGGFQDYWKGSLCRQKAVGFLTRPSDPAYKKIWDLMEKGVVKLQNSMTNWKAQIKRNQLYQNPPKGIRIRHQLFTLVPRDTVTSAPEPEETDTSGSEDVAESETAQQEQAELSDHGSPTEPQAADSAEPEKDDPQDAQTRSPSLDGSTPTLEEEEPPVEVEAQEEEDSSNPFSKKAWIDACTTDKAKEEMRAMLFSREEKWQCHPIPVFDIDGSLLTLDQYSVRLKGAVVHAKAIITHQYSYGDPASDNYYADIAEMYILEPRTELVDYSFSSSKVDNALALLMNPKTPREADNDNLSPPSKRPKWSHGGTEASSSRTVSRTILPSKADSTATGSSKAGSSRANKTKTASAKKATKKSGTSKGVTTRSKKGGL